jgi:hypothetical protein
VGVSQVAVRSPFAEVDLRDKLRLEPAALFHLFRPFQAQHDPALLRQIRKWHLLNYLSGTVTPSLSAVFLSRTPVAGKLFFF